MTFYLYRHYVVALFLFIIVTLASQLFSGELDMVNITLVHLLPVIVIALRGDMIATAAVTTLAVAALAVFYVPPYYSFYVHNVIYLWSFIIFYVVGYIITIQAQRIHSNSIKETLLNTLSHDLKTPLSSILGNATLLLEHDRIDSTTQKHVLEQIKASSQSMNRLISNLLDSARLQHTDSPIRKEWCDIEDLIGVALQEFNDSPSERFSIRIGEGLPLFLGDSNLLVRLLVNLLDNALKYSDEDKQVRIEISETIRYLSVRVCNECPPIKKADLQNMFDKFYRLENTADILGSGIGLSICKEITHAHKGTICAYNTEYGVCIEVMLPIPKPTNS